MPAALPQFPGQQPLGQSPYAALPQLSGQQPPQFSGQSPDVAYPHVHDQQLPQRFGNLPYAALQQLPDLPQYAALPQQPGQSPDALPQLPRWSLPQPSSQSVLTQLPPDQQPEGALRLVDHRRADGGRAPEGPPPGPRLAGHAPQWIALAARCRAKKLCRLLHAVEP